MTTLSERILGLKKALSPDLRDTIYQRNLGYNAALEAAAADKERKD